MEPETSAVCRICQSDGDPILRPCQCEGTMAYAHPYCLAEWIASRGELSCEVCGVVYTFQVAVEDAPPLASLEGLRLAVQLLLVRPLQRFFKALFMPLQVLMCCAVVSIASTVMWRSVSAHVILQHTALGGFPFFVESLYIFGAIITIVPLALLWLFEQFSVWAFLHEDSIAGLPPEAPLQPSATPALDSATSSALNRAFTRCSTASESVPRSRYLSVTEMQMSKDTTLQLLKEKVRASHGTAHHSSSWSFGPLWYSARILLVHTMGVSAVVLGYLSLYTLKWLCHILYIVSKMLLSHPGLSPLIQAGMTVNVAVVPPYVHWIMAFMIGLMELPLILCVASRYRRNVGAWSSRTLFLCSLFTRSIALNLTLCVTWGVVIPVVVYVCLIPFFVEGDVAPLMERRDAWLVLRAERLLPLYCDGATSGFAPVVQPLNVARALFFVLPDVLRGEYPPLFDTVTCGAAVSSASAHNIAASLVEFVWYSAGVLIRISTFSTWITLIATMRTTLMWLLTGSFVVFAPYLTLASDLAENDFFFAFLCLHGRAFWRTLLEVPVYVAMYTVFVGFGAFLSLHHLFPEAFPKSLTYLSLYSSSKLDAHFQFLYCWFDILKRLYTHAQSWLWRCFLDTDGATVELQPQGSQIVETSAYVVTLLCVHLMIGAAVEYASWCSWFSVLGFALALMLLPRRDGVLNDVFPQIRRSVQNWKMRAITLFFYGASVEFTGVDTCVCRRLVHVKPTKMVSVLIQGAIEQNDTVLLLLLSSLDNSRRYSVVACPRHALHYLTIKTVEHMATVTRLGCGALIALCAPLLVCSKWHLNYVDLVSADYVALPLWLQWLLRWTTGALALALWVFFEGVVLRTSLFHRFLEYAPQLFEGTLSMKAIHAVVLPLVIHSGLVRFIVAVVYFTYNGSLLYSTCQVLFLLALCFCLSLRSPLEVLVDGAERRAAFDRRRTIMDFQHIRLGPPVLVPTDDADRPAVPRDDVDNEPAPRQNNNVAVPQIEEQQVENGPRQPLLAYVVAVAAALPGHAQLRARFARWVASQTPSDVVLVAHVRSPVTHNQHTAS